MRLSLDQHMPPGRKVPTSGGFLGRYPTNPSKDNKLRDPLDVRKNTIGPRTKLLIDLDRAKSPSALTDVADVQFGHTFPRNRRCLWVALLVIIVQDGLRRYTQLRFTFLGRFYGCTSTRSTDRSVRLISIM